MRAWKERGLRRLAPLAADLLVALLERPAADVITYIPPDPLRQLERACHPAQALAHELGRRWGIECDSLLRRSRATARQAALSRDLRAGNMRRAFGALRETDGRVLLVDDVYTTGATANAAATALHGAGAARVEVVTFVRAIR